MSVIHLALTFWPHTIPVWYINYFPHHTVTSLTLICACSQEHEWVQIDWFDLYRAEASANDRCQLDVSGSVFHSFGRFVQNGPLFYRFDSGTMAGTHFHVSFHSTVSKKSLIWTLKRQKTSSTSHLIPTIHSAFLIEIF